MIRFNVRKPKIPDKFRINKAKEEFLQRVGNLILEELFVATSSKGADSVGMKTGLLRKSLRMEITGDQVIVYFDPQVAPYAKFVVEGTRYIEARGILNKVLDRVQTGEGYIQARQRLLNAIGL